MGNVPKKIFTKWSGVLRPPYKKKKTNSINVKYITSICILYNLSHIHTEALLSRCFYYQL